MPEPKYRDASGRKASRHVADAFLTKANLANIQPGNLQNVQKKVFWAKSSRSQWVNKTKYTVQITKYKLQAENK